MSNPCIDVYQACPSFENETYQLRFVSKEDCQDLLQVYSDEKAVPLFNSDNCGGGDFHYTTLERMAEAVEYWLFEYKRRGFVRWSILAGPDRETGKRTAVGTIELFHRDSADYFSNCGLLRLDLASRYETAGEIERILSLILTPAFDLFLCDKIASKAIPAAKERITAFKNLGFQETGEKLIGHDGTRYGSYYVLHADEIK